MRQAIQSLSLFSGAAVVAAACALLALPFLLIRRTAIQYFAAFLIPVTLAYCLYWSPVWLSANPSEYFSWAFLFYAVWSGAGVVSFGTVLLLAYVIRKCAASVGT